MPFPSTTYPENLRQDLGKACLDRPVAEVHKAIVAGTFSDYGPVPIPYGTVHHYATKARARRRAEDIKRASKPKGETVSSRNDRLAFRVQDLAEARLDRWQETDRYTPKDLVEVADVLGKLARVAQPGPTTNGTEPPADPLTTALLNGETPKRRGRKPKDQSETPKDPANTPTNTTPKREVTPTREPNETDLSTLWLGDRSESARRDTPLT